MYILKPTVIILLFVLLSTYHKHKVFLERSSEKYNYHQENRKSKSDKKVDFIRPNLLLTESIEGINPGDALLVVVGCEGVNSTFLAQKGWNVTCYDISNETIKTKEEKAKQKKLKITNVCASSGNFDFGIYKWDLVVLCYADEISGGCIANDNFIPVIAASLKKGGLLIYEMGHRDFYLKKTDSPGLWGCTEEQLTQNFLHAGFEILKCEAKTDLALQTNTQPFKRLKFVAKKL